MKHSLVRLLSACALLLAFVTALPSQPARAQAQADLPAGLYQAFLEASSQPLAFQNGSTTAQVGGLNVHLDQSGVQAQSGSLNWSIALSGFGRGQQVEAVQAPQVVQSGERIEYQRGSLTEWYREAALGLEQGFTIPQAPQGEGQLTLQLAVQTDLQVDPSPDGSGLSFAGPDNQNLRYDNLRAFDAKGSELKASMSYTAGQVTIRVDDAGAAYPLTVDPLIYHQHKVIAPGGASYDQLGYSAALYSDTALVGALCATVSGHVDQGAAYVFVRSGASWNFQQKLTASDGAAEDNFGGSVALSGDTALVGANYATVGGHASQGAAYVFVRSGTTWSLQKKLTASDGAADNFFGWSVALSGDTALVGANYATVGSHASQGAAYVFVRSGTAWSFQKKLTASDGAASDKFGWSVALSGNTALVGAVYASVGGHASQGAAYVFVRSGTAWSFQKKLTASDGAAGDGFGSSVALSGDTALVGAAGATVSSHSYQGAAYVFVRSGTAWSQQKKLTASDGAADNFFGCSVALSGNTALVGVSDATVGGHISQGAAYVFTRSGTTWSQQAKLTASDGAEGNVFGSSVALSGDTALVGASGATVSGHTDQGAAYIFKQYKNLALNGGFNAYPASSQIPTSWTAVHFSASDGKDTTTKKEGAASVRFNGQASTTKTLTQSRTISGPPGDSFIFSLYAKAASIPTTSGVVQAQVQLYNGSTLVQAKTITFSNGTYGFTKKSLTFTASGSYTKIVIKLTYSKASGTVWFDALSLLEAP